MFILSILINKMQQCYRTVDLDYAASIIVTPVKLALFYFVIFIVSFASMKFNKMIEELTNQHPIL